VFWVIQALGYKKHLATYVRGVINNGHFFELFFKLNWFPESLDENKTFDKVKLI